LCCQSVARTCLAMKLAFVLPMTSVAELPLIMNWVEWKDAFGVAFNGDEDVERESIYNNNVAFITSENDKDHSYVLGVNQFSHLTEEEFLARHTGAKDGAVTSSEETFFGNLDERARADAVDWTTQGVVNPIKDQGQCGSCWAFSAVGTVESALALSGRSLTRLSEQQLLDCEDYTQAGCGGGYNNKAMTFMSQYGVCSEKSYPYSATDFDDDTCQAGDSEHGHAGEAKCTFAVQAGIVTGYTNTPKTVDGLEAALNQQPVSVTIKADSTFQSYRSGVLSESCPFLGQINHAVIAVGYDDESFKIRNSWGESWGEAGYVRIAKGVKNPFCLFKQAPVVPTLVSDVSV